MIYISPKGERFSLLRLGITLTLSALKMSNVSKETKTIGFVSKQIDIHWERFISKYYDKDLGWRRMFMIR